MTADQNAYVPAYGLLIVIIGLGIIALVAVIVALIVRNSVRNRRAARAPLSTGEMPHFDLRLPGDDRAAAGADKSPTVRPRTLEQRLADNDVLYERGEITAKEHSKRRRAILDRQ